ncbi:hypothetical protein ZIOFF_036863 [Zingiber officinale]|uniref:Photosystem II reaction center Psb28 protein n=1 Tax=Zingiber officinale TaxID=94328 RepID=A0A8J5GIS3_ZINOF|nr:hypothetical protein ZIOFF_036863 [Zingiber officinale]
MTKGFQVMEWIEGHDASNDDDNGDDEEAPRLSPARPMSNFDRLGHIEAMLEEGLMHSRSAIDAFIPVLASPPAVPGTNLRAAFAGRPLCLPPPPAASRAPGPWNRSNNRHSHFPGTRPVVLMMGKPAIQFIQGTDEQTIPDVRLTKSRDGTNGVAIFSFDQPSVFDSSGELGDITGFYMIDEEGVLQSVDVSAKFVNGKPSRIEAKYVMRSPREWDRFMRFMERYSQANGLQFVKN